MTLTSRMALRSRFKGRRGRGVFGAELRPPQAAEEFLAAELRPPQAAEEFLGAELRTRFVSFTGINNPICTCTGTAPVFLFLTSWIRFLPRGVINQQKLCAALSRLHAAEA